MNDTLDEFARRLAEELRYENSVKPENRLLTRKPRQLHIWIDPDLHTELTELAEKLDCSAAAIVRCCVKWQLAKSEIRNADFRHPTEALFRRDVLRPTTSLEPVVPQHRPPLKRLKFGESL